MESMAPVAILKNYFGLKQGQTLGDFLKEIKELSPESRTELTELAAIQLGVSIKEV